MSKLDKRIRDVKEAAPSNYDAEVTHHDRIVSIVVKSSDSWFNAGELGMYRAHLILGKRGGIRELEISNSFTGASWNYAENMKFGRKTAWRRTLERIRSFE